MTNIAPIAKWLQWCRARALRRYRTRVPAAHIAAPRRDIGEYQPLYIFLRDRYANRVVMTFAEIEELLAFPLPALARGDRNWWASAGPSAQSLAWTQANRTAAVNLSAESVAFDHRDDD